MTVRRQSRGVRRTGVSIRLTARDEAMLRALVRFGAVRTPDLVGLLFSNVRPDTAARRLRKAFDAGLVDVRASDRARPNVYCLGPVGRAWAHDHGLVCARVPRGDLEHHLGIVNVWCHLAAASHAQSGVRLLRFVPDWELRRQTTLAAAPVIPDAMVELLAEDHHIRFAFEFDRGGERSRAWRRKLDGYRRWLNIQPEHSVGLILLATGGARRQAVLAQLIEGVASWSVVLGTENLRLLLPAALFAASPYDIPSRHGVAATLK